MSSDILYPAIATQMGYNKILEFQDNMQFPEEKEYAKGWGDDSKISVELIDYPDGFGKKSVSIKYNLGMNDIMTLLSFVSADRRSEKEFYRCKRIESVSKRNDSKVLIRRFYVKRSNKMPDGSAARSPYFVSVSEGYALPDKNVGFKADSYKEERNVFIRITDQDMELRVEEVRGFLRDFSLLVRFENQMLVKKKRFDLARKNWREQNFNNSKSKSEKNNTSAADSRNESNQNTSQKNVMSVEFLTGLEALDDNLFSARASRIKENGKEVLTIYFEKDKLKNRKEEIDSAFREKRMFRFAYEVRNVKGKQIIYFSY